MVQKANELIKPKPNYEIETLDPRTGGGVRATMTVTSPDGSVMKYSRVGPNKNVAKRLCAEDAMSAITTWSHNYTSLCNLLCQVYLPE
jgi:hypothetical protein